MEFVTLAYVKALVGIKGDETEHDALIEHMIEAVSTQAERFMNRVVQRVQQTQYFDVDAGDFVFALRSTPVTSIVGTGEGVWNDPTWLFTSAVDATTYRVAAETGILYVRTGLAPGPQALKVVYTGGMAATTEKLMATYPDLAQAAARQTMFLYNTRKQIGADSISVGESSVSWKGDVAWLPGVEEVLKSYRRAAV